MNGRYALREAVDYSLANFKEPTSDFKLCDVLEEFLEAKKAGGSFGIAPQRSFHFKEAKELMDYVVLKDRELVPYFALALFAGMGSQYPGGELGKIALMGEGAWELIDFRNKVIRIPPETSKTGEYRAVNIQPSLAEWLKPFAKEKAPIAVKNFERRLQAIRQEKKLGHDLLRHTFTSMQVT